MKTTENKYIKQKVDGLYLARNISSSLLAIANLFKEDVGLVFSFDIKLLINKINSTCETLLLEDYINQSLEDRGLLMFKDDNSSSFIGLKNLSYKKHIYKFPVNIELLLLTIPDRKLRDFLILNLK